MTTRADSAYSLSSVLRKQLSRFNSLTTPYRLSGRLPSLTANHGPADNLSSNLGTCPEASNTKRNGLMQPVCSSCDASTYHQPCIPNPMELHSVEELSKSQFLPKNTKQYGIVTADTPLTPEKSSSAAISPILKPLPCPPPPQAFPESLGDLFLTNQVYNPGRDSPPKLHDLAEVLHLHQETISPIVSHLVRYRYSYADLLGPETFTNLKVSLESAAFACHQSASIVKVITPHYAKKLPHRSRFTEDFGGDRTGCSTCIEDGLFHGVPSSPSTSPSACVSQRRNSKATPTPTSSPQILIDALGLYYRKAYVRTRTELSVAQSKRARIRLEARLFLLRTRLQRQRIEVGVVRNAMGVNGHVRSSVWDVLTGKVIDGIGSLVVKGWIRRLEGMENDALGEGNMNEYETGNRLRKRIGMDID